MIHRPTPQISTEPEVLVTSDYKINTTLKERDIGTDSTGSLMSPGGEGSTGIIVGVSIAGALVVLITALVLVIFFRKRKRRNCCKREGNQINAYEQGNILGNSFISLTLHLTYFMKIYRTIKL